MRGKIVTVLGGSGFLGRHVVQHLCAADARVRVPCRDPDRALFLKPAGDVGQVALIKWAAGDDQGLAAALEGADAVVNLIGILHEPRKGDFQRLHAELPATIARTAPAGARIVHVSALGASAQSPSLYARTKAAGEAALTAARPDAVILRPSVVFGPEDSFLNRFAGMVARFPLVPLVGGGRTRFQPVFVGDVAAAITRAIAAPELRGVYELGGPEVMSMKEIMQWLMTVLRRHKPLVNLPFGVAEFQARFLQYLPEPPLTPDQVVLLKSDNVLSGSAPGLRELGIMATPMTVAAPDYLAYLALPVPRHVPQ